MIAESPNQLKRIIKKKAQENGIPANILMQYYMLERLLERMSISRFRHKFILKGGLLVAGMVGLNSRTTMDMDVVVDGFDLTHDELLSIFDEICAIRVDDNISFRVIGLSDIRLKEEYPGIRLTFEATYAPIVVGMTVDVTTGSVITPYKMDFPFPLLLDDRSIDIFSYNLETVLAEKLETVLARNTDSTRMRDYYDLFTLEALYGSRIDQNLLRLALERTTKDRDTDRILEIYPEILEQIRESDELRRRWDDFRVRMDYSRNISFDETCDAVQRLMDSISSRSPSCRGGWADSIAHPPQTRPDSGVPDNHTIFRSRR